MDRYEYKVRVAQIKSLIANRDFYEAMNIVDTIDWRRVRSASMLGMVSEIYKVNRRYDDAKGILMMMYNRNPELRTTVYALCEISIKLDEITDAVKYLKEYMRLAKGDSGIYILQYKLYRSQNVGIGECIELLKKLKAVEYDERWAYELAYLYHLDGQEKKCIEECDELIVWFGRGRYVTKAMELKMQHAPLTEDQKRKYDASEEKSRNYKNLEEDGDSNDLEESEVRLEDEVRDYRPARKKSSVPPLPVVKKDIRPAEEMRPEAIEEPEKKEERPEAEKIRIAPIKIEPVRKEPVRIEPVRTEPVKIEAIRTESVETEPMETEAMETELMETEAVETEEYPADKDTVKTAETGAEEIEAVEIEEESSEDTEEAAAEVAAEDTEVRKTAEIRKFPEIKENVDDNLKAELKPEIKTDPDNAEARFEDAKPDPLPTEAVSAMPVEMKTEDLLSQPTRRIPHKEILSKINVEEIEVKPFNTGVYSTANLQDEIRRNLAEFAKRTGQPIREPFLPVDTTVEAPKEDETESDISEDQVEEKEDTSPLPELQEAKDVKLREKFVEKADDEEEDLPQESIEKPKARNVKRRFEPEDDLYQEESIKEKDRPREIKADTARLPKIKKAKKKEEADKKAKAKKYKAPVPKEVKGFTEEEKEIFADFLAMHDLPEMIRDALNNIEMVGNRGNVIITGNEESARIRLAGAIANDLRETNPDFMGKIAKIKSELLNKKDIHKAIRSLDTGALLIERAGDLSEKSLETLKEMLEDQDTSIVLFLEDARLTMKKTIASHSWMEDYFNVSINIPTYTNDDLVFHAREYARQKEYTIDDMGVLALYTRIDEMQTADHAVNINEVEKIVDSAISHADRRTPGHLIDLIVGKRYDDNDLIVLREKDFIV